MRIASLLGSLALIATLAPLAHAESDWQKTYPLNGRPTLSVSAGDTALEVRSCGSCSQISIRVEWNDRKSSDYSITENQQGNSVSFTLKERPGFSFHIGSHRAPRVRIETPAASDVEAHTADGSLALSGIQGNLNLRTADGSVDIADVTGALHLSSSDGSVHIHNAAGTLESHSNDGSVQIDGRFSSFQVRTGDGALDFTLADGSRLTAPSRIDSSDGSVRLHVPASLQAELDARTEDGGLDCRLPLTTRGFNSSSDSGHHVRGSLNGGGTELAIHGHDGSVTISAL